MTYKNLLYTTFGALVCLFLALPAGAQRTNSGGGSKPSGGGGGGSRPSGGGGSRPSGGASYSRPPGSPGVARSSGAARSSTTTRGYINRQGGAVRGNSGAAPRTGVVVQGNNGGQQRAAVNSYRTAPQIGYGGYWGNHGYYAYNHGYYNTYYRPRLGFSVGLLPYGYYPFYWGDYQYFYSDGLYYQYDNSQYTVVEPPIGAEITTLPDKAQSIVINGVQYYELNGVYYQPITKDDGTVVYEIVGKDGQLTTSDGSGAQVQNQQPQGPQMGDIVTQLPDNCRKIKVNGTKLWVSADGIYYQEQTDANGNKTYKIVGLPSDEPDAGQN